MATLPKAKEHSRTAHRDDSRPTTLQPGSATRTGEDGARRAKETRETRETRGEHDGSGASASAPDSTRAAPYTHAVPTTQPHTVVPRVPRVTPSGAQDALQEPSSDEPVSHPRQTERVVGIAVAAVIAAAAFWLERRK